jgi:methylase of polypeptide subunit release factors
MGSLNKQYSHDKLLGRVYTPEFIVQKILDDIQFDSERILGKSTLDPACGDGQFLLEVAKRIIKFSPSENLVENLLCVHGWDIDAQAAAECVENLNKIVEPLGIRVKWNVRCLDSIKKHQRGIGGLFPEENNGERFDYIVGNPPYIRIQHLDAAQRDYIQENYDFCKSGSTDIYIAFYELCLNLLSETGVCGLITPNTFLFTETARAMRERFGRGQNIVQITNYGDIQLFDKISTYSAIVLFNKAKNKHFKFEKASGKQTFSESAILTSKTLTDSSWRLSSGNLPAPNGRRLGDICKIHVGLTTLCDKAYIFPVTDIDDETVLANTKFSGSVRIERGILRPIIKGSKLKSASQPVSEWILFPYLKVNGKHVIMRENELISKYPLAYGYLLSVREWLDKRDNGKPNQVAWYAFGRTQGLETTWGAKIIFSPISEKPNFIYYANPESALYSGYCIKYDGDIAGLLSQLNSERMEKFIAESSRDFRGGWKAYNKKVVENFIVENPKN